MKQIIKGVVYNTENSKRIGVRCGDVTNGHLNAEILYKTGGGQYFLCESDILNCNKSSGRITPLPAKDAETWAKKHLGEYAYAAEFGKPQPDNTNMPKILNISLPPDLMRKLDQLQSEQGKTISQIIESALRKKSLKLKNPKPIIKRTGSPVKGSPAH